MATQELDILIQEILKDGSKRIMYPFTRAENVVDENLDPIKIAKWQEITIDTNWTGSSAPYTKVISIANITANNLVRLYPIWSNVLETRAKEREEYAKISKVDSQAGGIKITCDEEKPSISLNVRLEVF